MSDSLEQRWYGAPRPTETNEWIKTHFDRMVAEHVDTHGSLSMGGMLLTRKKPAEDAAAERWYGNGETK